MNRNFIIAGISFVIYIFIQIILLKHLVAFDLAFCFLYLAALLLLPFETGKIALMLIGAALGFTVDLFYDSLGIHMAACVFIAFIRPYYISLVTPRGGYDIGSRPILKDMGLGWFSFYSITLIFIHHLIIFYIEASGSGLFFLTLLKAFLSTLFTWLILMIVQYLFYSPMRK
jgi:hypothetical protein